MLAPGNQNRASAQARIAASAPRTTYGKHKNKLLPLTGSQFLRNDVFGTIDKRVPAKDIIRRTYQESSADDSPLSDAEPIREKHSKQLAVVRTRQPRAPATSTSTVKSSRRKAGDIPGASSDTGTGQEGDLSRSQSPHRVRSEVDRHKSRRSAPAHKRGKLKSAGVVRGRLPLNELVLVTGAGKDDVFEKPNKNHGMLARDPISSSGQPLLDAVSSGDGETTPAKRKAKVPLSAIRKRLRTRSSGYKSLERLRRKYNAPQLTPMGSRPRQIVGDGFERSELTPNHPSRYTIKHMRMQREPLLAGLQALSLVSGPLPEVVFVSDSNPSQLKFGYGETSDHNETSSGYEAPATDTALDGEPNRSLNRRVSFNHYVERVISAQLASISAPKREPSIALVSDDENEDEDDGDEGGDEDEGEDDDDEAADSYLDRDDIPPDESHSMVDREVCEIDTLLPESRQKPQTTSPEPREGEPQSMGPASNGFIAKPKGLRTPSFRRRTFSGRPLLNEVNEPIDDDFRIDDMLLGHEEGPNTSFDCSEVEYITTNKNCSARESTGTEGLVRSSNRNRPGNQIAFGRSASIQPRSILKNNTPHISSDSNRPESTAANTRRNSMVDVEESRYFSAAKDQLDSTPTKQPIIRKKSSSRFYNQIEVPYSDEMVLETSPKKPDYTNASQMHLLKRTNEALWTSSAALVPQTDLRSLTRSVSKENGTLSQAVRRRSSRRFQSPKKVV